MRAGARERSRLSAITSAGMPITSQFSKVTCCGTYGNGRPHSPTAPGRMSSSE